MPLTSGPGVTPTLIREDSVASTALSDAVDVLLRFGALMLRAGNTATRTREWIEVMARKMGFDAVSLSLSLDSITASVRRSGESATTMREIGPPGINACVLPNWRILQKHWDPNPRRAKSLSRLRKSSQRSLSIQACRLPRPSG